MRMRQKVELLAPAGSMESMKAAICAGADAVYIGGSRFGARAFADNLDEAAMKEAIDYAHLHGVKLYLTVNTLVKEAELRELYDYLAPFYEQGLDAVIVQDIGVLSWIRRQFPDLPIHASTQMTITGKESAKLLEQAGVTRVVTARELSLREIAEIRDTCHVEIESFVHGALCYCYSGQCLFSSMVGGRSGNRGRCAQPCRLPYEVYVDGKMTADSNAGYVLSPKDLNTLTLLPEIIEAGVMSLKIEGRMKKPEYTAGVVSIYRKYVDRYLKFGKEAYRVEKEDMQKLWDLFNRKGFTQGYYRQHNGSDMITHTKADFRMVNEKWNQEIKKRYVDTEKREKVTGMIVIAQEVPTTITLQVGDVVQVSEGAVPEKSIAHALTSEQVRRQMNRLGGSPFEWEQLDVYVDEGVFLPVSVLNEMRREAFSKLTRALTEPYHRHTRARFEIENKEKLDGAEHPGLRCSVKIDTEEQLEAALEEAGVFRIYVDSLCAEPKRYAQVVRRIHAQKKECFLVMPRIMRTHAKQFLNRHEADITAAGWDGFLISSLECLAWMRRRKWQGVYVSDHMLYAWTQTAQQMYRQWDCWEMTLPVELTEQELRERGCAGAEMIVYGRIPMMVSAQCLKKTTGACDHTQSQIWLKDRKQNRMLVKNFCTYCYNIIYNSKPLSLFDRKEEVVRLHPDSIRLEMTTETKKQVREILHQFVMVYQKGEPTNGRQKEFTRGNFNRKAD